MPDNQNSNQHSEAESSQAEQNTQNIGKNMMFIAWGFALVIATWVFGVWEKKQVNPNASPLSHQTNDATEVVLKRNRYGHYLASGTINRKSVTFFVDTGATDVAIPGELQQSLGLMAGRSHQVNTANGITQAFSTTIEELSIGDIRLTNVKASIVPNMEGEEILLGMSVLKQLEFSQKGRQLILRQNH